jgi:SAM-dependent methyltransferase
MNAIALQKYRSAGKEVSIQSCDLRDFPSNGEPFDVIVAVNCLYTLEEPEVVLGKLFDRLEPGGYLFCIDLGRSIDTASWVKELVKHSVNVRGLIHTVRLAISLRQAFLENLSIEKAQNAGKFWEHSPDEFRQLFERRGFSIVQQSVCYRDKCDQIVGQRPPSISVDRFLQGDGNQNQSRSRDTDHAPESRSGSR